MLDCSLAPPADIRVIAVGRYGRDRVRDLLASGIEVIRYLVLDADTTALRPSPFLSCLDPSTLERSLREASIWMTGTDAAILVYDQDEPGQDNLARQIEAIARDQGILTIALAIQSSATPAQDREVDLSIPIRRPPDLPVARSHIPDAKAIIDVLTHHTIHAIVGLSMTTESVIGIDFVDVMEALMQGPKGMAGTGIAWGEQRARKATEAALAHVGIDRQRLPQAQGVLVAIVSDSSLTHDEIYDVLSSLEASVPDSASVIVGTLWQADMADTLRVNMVVSSG